MAVSEPKSRPISSLSLSDLRQLFGVERDRHDPFFKQWLTELDNI